MPSAASSTSPSTKRAIRLTGLILIGCAYWWTIWSALPWITGHRFGAVDQRLIAWIYFAFSFGPLAVGCIVVEFSMAEETRRKILIASFVAGLVLPGLLNRSSWPTDQGQMSLAYEFPWTSGAVIAIGLALFVLRRATR
jgi:hypothetical protein